VDSTRLANAASDVEALFQVYAGVAYDSTVATHRMSAVPAVVDMLRVYSGQILYSEIEAALISRFQAVAKVTGRDRIKAETDSLLDPTEDTSNAMPKSDRQRFRGYVPGAGSDNVGDYRGI
jgi:hypothetical protein